MAIKPSEQAALDIVEKYGRYLLAEHMGNQDKYCLVRDLSLMIENRMLPKYDSIAEALNSGDGSYKP